MEIRIKGKTYKIAWEFIIAPFLILLAVAIIMIVNISGLRRLWIDYTGDAAVGTGAGAEAGTATEADSPVPASMPGSENITDFGTVQTPAPPEKTGSAAVPVTEPPEEPGKININKAGMEELMTLPFIGEVKARAIIQYRTENGPFKTVDDLDNVKGIGAKTLEKLRPFVTLDE